MSAASTAASTGFCRAICRVLSHGVWAVGVPASVGVPVENDPSIEENYVHCSPLSRVDGLTADQKLLLCYGTGDDNCHYQNCEMLLNELVAKDKYFELISYPNRTHAIEDAFGVNTRKHLYESITRHFVRHLQPTVEPTTAML